MTGRENEKLPQPAVQGAVISGKVDLPQISGSFGEGNVSLPFVMDAKVNLY